MKPTHPRIHETSGAPWVPTAVPGVDHKQLDTEALGGSEISLMRLASGTSLPAPDGLGQEIVVLTGHVLLPDGELGPGGYSRRPAAHTGLASSPTGCTLFVRSTPFAVDNNEVIHSPANKDTWVPGHGNLRVKPLHSFGTEGTAFVHWPKGERFLPHQHMGGEEIFVLSGTFEDEHGLYPTGTWILSPHLSAHHPFVREETTIFVKTGHLLAPTSA